MSEIRSPDGGAHPAHTDSRDCAVPSDDREWSYDDWWDQLDGLPSSLPASRVSLGRYAKRDASGGHYGIAIYPDAANRPWVRIGRNDPFPLGDAAAEEDLSFNTIAGAMPVAQEAYDTWFLTGTWPEGTVLDRPRPKPERSKTEVADARPAEKLPAVFIRLYETIAPPKPSMKFMARAIARTKSGGEGFSVGFYADTEAGARKLAEIWIAEKRAKAQRAEEAREARAARMRRPAAQSDQTETEGASA